MAEEYKVWICDGCGNEVHSIRYPTLINWDDGHKCRYKEVKEDKEFPTKGEKNA
jgi:hypothetical protein